jgi:peptidoglycan/LPS O-acetylase OafA/YrhL
MSGEGQGGSVRGAVTLSTRRNLYFDVLRGIALVRVVAYHTVGSWWLHVAFPAIGVMFALGGSLMARSLDGRGALHVVGSRMRRLLPPVWVYGIVAILMGWELLDSGERLVFWVLPLRDPYDSSLASGFVDTLWYLRTYLWFVLLSPLLLWAFRKAPVILALPLVLIPVAAYADGGRWTTGHGLVNDVLMYGTCWLLGFAEHDGLLHEVRMRWILAGGGLVAVLGLALVIMSPITPVTEPATVGYAVWSAAAVVVLLRWRPDLSWLRRRSWLHQAVEKVNARAVTIYLWHDPAIVGSLAIVTALGLHLSGYMHLPIVCALTAVAVLLFGWVEDLAAGRPLRLGTPTKPTASSDAVQAPQHPDVARVRQS